MSTQEILYESSQGAVLLIYLQPNAKRSEIVGIFNGYLKIKINAPPIDNKANNELVEFLSQILNLKKSAISIQSGETKRFKRVLILELTIQQITQKLGL